MNKNRTNNIQLVPNTNKKSENKNQKLGQVNSRTSSDSKDKF
jgi:hypothetical protein